MKNYIVWLVLFLLVIFRLLTFRDSYQNGQIIKITSRVLEEPVRYSFKQKIDLLGFNFYLPLYPEIYYGDVISVKGRVKKGELVNPELLAVYSGNSFLLSFREKIIAFYREVLPEPHASLMAGITLGSKSQIPDDFWQKLKKSGVLHVVVASGMNVTFVAGFLISLLTVFLSRKKALIFTILGIWFYVALSGFEAPLIRAGIMATFAFLAQRMGRLSFSWRILTLLKEGLATSIAAQIGVAPILFVTFGSFNFLSPIINMLVLWTIPGIMILGAVGGIMGLVFPFLGKLILYISYPLTWWFIKIVSIY